MMPEFAAQVAARYIDAYERLTGTTFAPAETPAAPRIEKALENWTPHEDIMSGR
jgi:hypothetical protein